VTWARRTLVGTNAAGYAGCCAAIRDLDMRDRLHEISTPALIICGGLDVPMPWTGHSEILATGIAGSVAVRLPAAHISNLETPRAFSAELHAFLVPPVADPLAAGFAVRRSVLGDTHVDRVSPTSAGQLSSKSHDVFIEPSFDYLVAVILV
jgi:3-oxoadipate enol-lactonase/4-carboxymuconolactone decarboxylase